MSEEIFRHFRPLGLWWVIQAGWFTLGAAGAVWSLERGAGNRPAGSVLVECESLPECAWHVYQDETASGGRKILANQPDWRAEGDVELPPGRYAVWVRSGDNGRYPGHYHYDLEINGRARTMAQVEPVSHGWVWEKWGVVEGGTVHVLLHRADTFPASADCLLFTPDPNFRPSGRDRIAVEKVETPTPFPRENATVTFTFAATASLQPDQKFFVVIRGGNGGLLWSGEIALPRPTQEWKVGEPVRVTAALPSLRFYGPGEYRLTAEFSESEFAKREEGDYDMGTFTLGPWKKVRPCVAKVRNWRSTPTLFINGKPTFAFAFLGVGTDRYHEFAATGGHLYSVGASLGNEQPGGFNAAADSAYRAVLEQDPEAYIFPRLSVDAPAWWAERHPEEMCLFDSGERGGQSFASRAWLRDLSADLTRYVEHVRNSPYADRVIGFHLCTGVSAEWQSWGLWSNQRGDFSQPFGAGFREWLRQKYRTVEALQSAWRDPEVTFETAKVPSRDEREKPGPLLRDPQEQRPVIDFYEFYPQPAAEAITTFAAVVKRASHRESLVGVFYGYAPQYGPLAPESQHLALARVLASPNVDFLCSPAMYSDRQPGGTSNFMSLTESIQQHGKFWFDEADIRTSLTPPPPPLAKGGDGGVGRCETLEETLAVLRREYAQMRAHGAGLWWFDMGGGWFSNPQIHALFRNMRETAEAALHGPEPPRLATEVAVVLDERSAFRHQPGPELWDFYHYGLTMQVASLPRLGAPSALYLLSDLPQLAQYKMIVFLNAFDLTDAQRRWIDTHLKHDGRTLVWIYAAGCGRVGQNGLATQDVDGITALTGLRVRRLPGAGSFRVQVDATSPLCQNLDTAEVYGGQSLWNGTASVPYYGPAGAGEPRFAVDDPAATALGRYAPPPAPPYEGGEQGGVALALKALGRYAPPPAPPYEGGEQGGVALALKQFSDWTSVYSAAPGLPSGLLRNLAQAAGVHIYTETSDAFYTGRGIVALHAWKSGQKAIRLPERFTVREILGGTPPLAKGGQGGGIVQATDRIEFDLNEKETRVFEVRSTSEE